MTVVTVQTIARRREKGKVIDERCNFGTRKSKFKKVNSKKS